MRVHPLKEHHVVSISIVLLVREEVGVVVLNLSNRRLELPPRFGLVELVSGLVERGIS